MTRAGPAGEASAAALARLRARFARKGAVRLAALLDAPLLAVVEHKLRGAAFEDFQNGGFDARSSPADPATHAFLALLFEDRAVLSFVEAATGCPPLARVTAGLFRMAAGHRLDWHNDCDKGRVVGLTINLSDGPVAGGAFEIRRRGGTAPLARLAPGRPGDAVLFNLDPALEHRSAPVRGARPKTIFSCWFHARGSGLRGS